MSQTKTILSRAGCRSLTMHLGADEKIWELRTSAFSRSEALGGPEEEAEALKDTPTETEEGGGEEQVGRYICGS